MLYPDDLERLAVLSGQVSRWLLRWMDRHRCSLHRHPNPA
jgi:hypothetical protein